MDHWVPTDEAHKWDLEKLLNYLESTLDDVIPQVQVNELEDIKERSDESIDELIDRILQLTHHAQIGNGSDSAIKFEVQHRLIWAMPDVDIKLQKELLKVSHEKKVSHLLEISLHIMPLSLEQLWCVLVKPYMPSTKADSPRKTSHKSLFHSAPTAPVHISLAMTTGLHRTLSANAVLKSHWHAKCCSSGTASQQPTKSDGAEKAPHHQCHGKGKKADTVQVNTEEAPPCNELFIDAVNCETVGDTHPEEIVVDDVCGPQCNEAYTMVQLPASTSSKGIVSLHIKVDTGAGGNVLPLHVFQHLYPNWISPDGPPNGSHQHQANCIQWIPYTPIWCTLWPHHLVAMWPWHSTAQGKLLLVCCRHPQSCHPRSSIMQKISSCQDELCCHSYPTWNKTSKPCTCSHSNSSQASCSLYSSQAHHPLMTSLRSFQISLQGLVDSLVSTQSNSVLMFIPSFMLPGNAPLPYVQRLRSTSTKWNTWEW